MGHRSRRQREVDWVSYERCFLFTLGGILLLLSLYVDITRAEPASHIVTQLLLAVFFLGLILVGVAVFASPSRVSRWAEQSSSHEVMLLVMLLAAPLYYLLRVRRKHR